MAGRRQNYKLWYSKFCFRRYYIMFLTIDGTYKQFIRLSNIVLDNTVSVIRRNLCDSSLVQYSRKSVTKLGIEVFCRSNVTI